MPPTATATSGSNGGGAFGDDGGSADLVREFVNRCRGSRVITRILIANNGMAAVKAIRSIRRWSYETFGDDRAIQFTVMATPEDLKVNAEYIRMADEYVEVPGGTSNNNYSNVDLIVDVAQRTNVHAVWVGWGFASENPILADKLTALEIVFIGPPSSAMRALGDKIASTIVAQSANVPCAPWSGTGITRTEVDGNGHVSVPADAYREATTLDVQEGLEHAERIGYPVMIKASEGGGGKGIRLVEEPKDFRMAFEQVSREIPGSPIFIMRVVRNARHLEVQLLADMHGNAIALFGRDCSVQRRHQKILEEAPVTVADAEARSEMEKAAVRLAQLVGYVSAGTVEYLYEPANKKFHFLELNPRLQVEHPTTEMVSGVNIPAAQLQIAMGIPLSCIKDIRILYGMTPTGISDIDFEFSKPETHQIQRKPSPKGHVIAARITAENPEAGFKPNSGKVLELNFRSNSNVWGYFSVNSSGGVHEFADSQFGHVFSYGETRNDARKNLIIALKELSIRGDFRTTVEYLVKLLESKDYVENTVTTGWLDAIIAKKVETERPDSILAAICGAVVKAHAQIDAQTTEYRRLFEKGQTPSKSLLSTRYVVDFIYLGVQYKMAVSLTGPRTYVLKSVTNGSSGNQVTVDAKKLADGGLLLLIDGKTHLVYSKEEPHATFMTLDGKSCLLEKENDPTLLRSPSPGKLIRYLVDDGAHLNTGDAFAEIEVMKMYMPLLATESGVVTFSMPPGSTLSTGDVVGRLVLDDPSRVKRAVKFDGDLPDLGPPQVFGEKAHQQYRQVLLNIEAILDGYEFAGDVSVLVRKAIDILNDGELPYLEVSEVLSSITNRIPAKVESKILSIIESYRNALQIHQEKERDDEVAKAAEPEKPDNASPTIVIRESGLGLAFPADSILNVIEETKSELVGDDLAQFVTRIQPVVDIIDSYSGSVRRHEMLALGKLIERYLEVEETFNDKRYEDVLLSLRDKHKNDLDRAVGAALAHAKPASRSDLMECLLDHVRSSSSDEKKAIFSPLCARLANLQGAQTAKVSLKGRELLIFFQLPTYEERHASIFEVLQSAVSSGAEDGEKLVERFAAGAQVFNYAPLSKLITANHAILDVLPSFFYHPNLGIRATALYTYVLHTYQAYTVISVRHGITNDPLVFQWDFVLRQAMQSTSEASSPLKSSRGSMGLYQHASSSSNFQYKLPTSSGRNLSFADRAGSFSDLGSIQFDYKTTRKGLMCAFESVKALEEKIESVIARIGGETATSPTDNTPSSPNSSLTTSSTGPNGSGTRRSSPIANVMNVAILSSGTDILAVDDRAHEFLSSFVAYHGASLRSNSVRRVTFMIVRPNQFPRYFTFKEQEDYREDPVIRHIEPAMAYQLELQRLQNFDIRPCFIDNRRLHIYHAVGKKNPADRRFFVRAIVYPGQAIGDVPRASTHEFLTSEGHRILTDIMDALEIVGTRYPNTDCNHLFINFIPTFQLDLPAIETTLKEFVDRHGRRLWKGRVTTAEVRFIRQGSNGTAKPIRFILSSVSGFVTKVEAYQEVRDATGVQRLMSLTSPVGSLHQQPVASLYTLKENIQPKRYKAHLMGTTYIYDFPELFRRALEKVWIKYGDGLASNVPSTIMNVTELVLNDAGELEETFREPGVNNCGMVAWNMELFTPEYPEGRNIVVVANDITFNIGSFGPKEDQLFFKASEYARLRGIPRIYISANSGARIGLADEVINKFKVAWNDVDNPAKGFKYLYLNAEGFNELVLSAPTPSVNCERIFDDGEERFRIVDVIGQTHGLGVENLQGSGLIAGETSLAYEEIFTLTLVTCRSVGIGAYLVRLGQRTIQVEYTPIILTGAGALNKVLGREVYTSNLQLGGTQIMYKNGVSHLVAQNDMGGVTEILNWLSYVPKKKDAPLPVLPAADSVDRPIAVEIPSGPYDPRALLAGYVGEDDMWYPGFFDQDSFKETLSGWAQGVVVGRGRLGGIPMGVIAVETRATEQIIYADPANDQSVEQTSVEAGQVWYPNSSFKTAQAIKDFNKGEQLPLIIFANWRGFSGGQSDMYKEVLKYGAYIVDALRDYKQPVFIYIIGELRGGAWVVLDPTINSEHMEMYAEEDARGGVLEPEGIVEIKFRKPQLLATMDRLDPTYSDLKKRLRDATLAAEVRAELQAKLDQREKQLLPVFNQVAVQFADLHDTPGRMLKKNAINAVVPWRSARKFFYWRLLRRISENSIIKEILDANPTISRPAAKEMVSRWFAEDSGQVPPEVPAPRAVFDSSDDDDERDEFRDGDLEVVRWINTRRTGINARVAKIKDGFVRSKVEELAQVDAQAALEGLLSAAKLLDADRRRALLDALGRGVCSNCDALREELEETKRDFEEFQTESREYEAELDKEVNDVKKRNQQLSRDLEELRSKLISQQSESNRTINSLQQELEALRKSEQSYRHQNRDLETLNSDLEQSLRVKTVTAEDWEAKYNRVLEKNIFLEHELDSKAKVEEETQRLRDELRDAVNELTMVQNKLEEKDRLIAIKTVDSPSLSHATAYSESEAPVLGLPDGDTNQKSQIETSIANNHSESERSLPPKSPPIQAYDLSTTVPKPSEATGAMTVLSDLLQRAKSLEMRITAARDKYVQPLLLNASKNPKSPLPKAATLATSPSRNIAQTFNESRPEFSQPQSSPLPIAQQEPQPTDDEDIEMY
ncbi:acetyl-coenzyme-A carboxylase [Phlyctochytrium planicorne]|nr:acetyl-coenzyme-A carboxylase [Phlyctochytrium planicorne]